ncbi:hypothetical protein [Methylobacterium sp. WSM2598]|uniref:hypothetical protein n=1 Tax=Methylobacterium sp. WSM2598 TaxID=398261 RepID=UPI000375C463|nr:hypothetical protein [Methylobacterium sp. WSM2598]
MSQHMNAAVLPAHVVKRMHRCFEQALIEGAGPDTDAKAAAEALLAFGCGTVAKISGNRELSRLLFALSVFAAKQADAEEAAASSTTNHRATQH